jgi:hypothetical protein
MQLFNFNEIDKQLGVADEEGRIVVQMTLLCTLYFEGAGSPEVRERVAACFDEYESVCGEHLRWIKHPKSLRLFPVGTSKVPSPREWLQKLGEGSGWELMFHGGEDPDEASSFKVRALGSPDAEGDLSYFQASLPVNWYAKNSGGFPTLVSKFCELLRPLSGYGGIGIVQSANRILESEFEPQVYTLAERFPGLEVDYPNSHILYLRDGIKGVNWLTFLGGEWLAKLGGLPALKKQAGEDFTYYETGGGVLIQAGERPQMGDSERDSVPSSYVRLAAALRPIRVKQIGSFHHFGPGRYDDESTARWLARFDPAGS